MSRAYRIRVGETVQRIVHVEDGVSSTLELLPVLPRPRMLALVAAELGRRGFRSDGEHAVRTEPDGVVVSIELATGEVTVSLAAESEVRIAAERSANVRDGDRAAEEAARERLRRRVAEDIDAGADRERVRLREDLADHLERRLRDLGRELDLATNRATAAALKERAAQLGEIEEIAEDDETGTLTIKVRV